MPIPTPADRIAPQLAFLAEADKLKTITRANPLADGSRLENSAEHSWHLCLWALVFEDQSRGANLARVWSMLLLHDLVEIDAGDHPIHLPHDADAVHAAERAAADRLFGLLPPDQTIAFRTLWDEFEDGSTTDAAFARMLDKAQPMFLALSNPHMTPTDRDVLHQIQTTGRFGHLHDDWPEVFDLASALLNRRQPVVSETLAARMRFVMEADRLKSVTRGTTIHDGSRRENSAEHSWHIMLWALTLQEHSTQPVRIERVLQMLLLHDLVEVDAGDNPIHGTFDAAAVAAQEQAAATRIFGLLPAVQSAPLRAIWDEFEAAASPDAIFAKSLDRAQPLTCNLATDGGSWRDYNVTRDQIETRVGVKVKRGAAAVWDALCPEIDAWFAANT
ncbi:HD domain-containing protein [Pseudooctadecabacter jejudonensis]|uniref:5'-nucleotidase n=1 Tax=Pseudooctadecabacter jejudonensis TaxID=1391910 RepID=A0A1Y5RLA6_9RHOB|nr:HD domain-containing protein [Pseudooctadecabacter jejudonensis]SLN17223.1 5'-nucleotidase [Pseudooctadecabacter jejudonensis]